MSPMHAQALPHAVAEHEAAVEHRYERLGARLQRAVDVDPDRVVARVVVEVLDALRHGVPCSNGIGNQPYPNATRPATRVGGVAGWREWGRVAWPSAARRRIELPRSPGHPPDLRSAASVNGRMMRSEHRMARLATFITAAVLIGFGPGEARAAKVTECARQRSRRHSARLRAASVVDCEPRRARRMEHRSRRSASGAARTASWTATRSRFSSMGALPRRLSPRRPHPTARSGNARRDVWRTRQKGARDGAGSRRTSAMFGLLRTSLDTDWCPGRDSNPHSVATART